MDPVRPMSHSPREEQPAPSPYKQRKSSSTKGIKYLAMEIHRRLIWRKHSFAKGKQLEMTFIKMHWLLGRKSKLSANKKFLIYKAILKPIRTYWWNTTVGIGFRFKQRNHRTLPI
jgi:hypothetical protein